MHQKTAYFVVCVTGSFSLQWCINPYGETPKKMYNTQRSRICFCFLRTERKVRNALQYNGLQSETKIFFLQNNANIFESKKITCY